MNNICSYCDFNDCELNKLFIIILNQFNNSSDFEIKKMNIG